MRHVFYPEEQTRKELVHHNINRLRPITSPEAEEVNEEENVKEQGEVESALVDINDEPIQMPG